MLPDSLRGNEPNTFVEYTIKVRLPGIARRVLVENDLSPESTSRVEALIAEIPAAPLSPITDTLAPDAAGWAEWFAPYAGQSWLDAPWLFVEFYFFRRILQATGYFRPGPWQGKDPYAYQKTQGWLESQAATTLYCQKLSEILTVGMRDPQPPLAPLVDLLHDSVWGNQADLSLWPVGQESRDRSNTSAPANLEPLLVDDAATLASELARRGGTAASLELILDNAGLELVHDLGLVDFLLSSGMVGRVRLHAKAFPIYVSDTTIADIWQTLRDLEGMPELPCRDFAGRLSQHLRSGRLVLSDDPFWCAPLSFWDAPDLFRQALGKGKELPPALILSKGDANYRRFLGDRHWPIDMPLESILRSLPAPLALLRVFKSEVAAGLPSELLPNLAELEKDWMVNGKWAVLQFFRN